MTTLLIADGEATAHALTAALRLGGEVHILEVPANALAEPLAQSIADLGGYDAIVAPATSTGKNLLPRIAALLDVMLISDILEVAAPDTFRRPTYAGNAIETVQSSDRIKVVTVRASAFPPTATHGLKAVSVAPAGTTLSRIVSEDAQKAAGPELGSARIGAETLRQLTRRRRNAQAVLVAVRAEAIFEPARDFVEQRLRRVQRHGANFPPVVASIVPRSPHRD